MSQLLTSSIPTATPTAGALHPDRVIAAGDCCDTSRNPVLVYLSQLRQGSRRTVEIDLI